MLFRSVMVTLNDRRIFDFERFLESYSRTIWPLFLWHMLFYVRHRKMSMHFDMADLPEYMVPSEIRSIDHIPSTATGKADYHLLESIIRGERRK